MNQEKNYNFLFFVYFLIYVPWFSYLEKHVTYFHQMNTYLDDNIPFCKYFVVPYIAWFFYVCFAYIYFYNKTDQLFKQMGMFLTLGMTIALLICTIFPNGLYEFRPDNIQNNDIFDKLILFIYSSDTSTNVFPSIHVYNSIGVNLAIQKFNNFKYNKIVHFGSNLLCILICMSTILIKQHSLYDVMGSIILAIIIYQFTYKTQNKEVFIKEKTSEN